MSDSTGRARRNNGSISGANGRVVGVLLDRRAQAKLLKGRDREKMGSMIGKQAFDVLGIAPTDDGREIRADESNIKQGLHYFNNTALPASTIPIDSPACPRTFASRPNGA